jgi:RHS repeat-associated protein
MRFGYDDLGHLTEVINSSGLPLRYTYDHANRITSWTDRNHTSYHYTYDTEGRCIRGEGTNGFQSGTFHYDTANRTTRVTNSLGHTTTIEYNNAYRPTRETDPLGNTTLTEWDNTNEHVVAVTDPLGRMTAYEYDEAGRAIAVRRADGTEFRVTFNRLSLPLETVEPGGGIWRYAYDDKGNRLETVDPSGAVTRYTYDGRGVLVEAIDAVGGRRFIECNDAGLPTLINDALGNRTIMNRDALGRVAAVTDALGNVTRLDWATEGNLVCREHPDGSREIWSWDGEGNLVSQTDPAGTLTSYTNTYFDLRSSVTEADGTGYQFTYDSELRPIRVTNSSGAHWDYEFDAAGHLVSETDFDGRRISYSVNAAGELVERTNGAGETVRYVRDALGRVIRLEGHACRQTTFVYDEAGRLLRAVGQHGDLERTYDPLGRILSEMVGGHRTEYGYDAVGNRIERRTPSGVRTTWRYDLEGRPVEMVTAGRRIDLAYDAAGRPKARSFDGGLTITDAWDESDRLLSQVTAVGATEVQCRSYTRRHDGLITEYEDLLDGVRHIDLDAVGRPVGVHADGWNERYAYDTHGNLTHVSTPIAEMDLEFDRTRIVRSNRASYEYDGQGRLVRRTLRLLNGQRRVWTYIWDADDRLAGAVTPLGERWRYTYDPLGRRLTKERCSESGEALEWIRFVWDGTRLSEQTSHTGATVTWDYEPGTHRPLVQTQRRSAGDMCQSEVDARFHAIITDLVGAPTELVDTSGAVAWRMRGTVWGQIVEDPDYSVECPLRFPGQYHDAETGLYYNCRRYYDPDIGRYITPDPLGIDPSPNPYAYVSNPFVWADPLGLAPCKILYHYTTEDGLEGILKSQSLRKSTGDVHARYGDGQYFTDIAPSMIKGLKKGDLTAEDMANGGLSKYQVVRSFFGRPTRWGLNKISHYVAVDVSDLDIIEGRPGTLVHLSGVDLNVASRIVEHGKTPF